MTDFDAWAQSGEEEAFYWNGEIRGRAGRRPKDDGDLIADMLGRPPRPFQWACTKSGRLLKADVAGSFEDALSAARAFVATVTP